MSDDNFETSKHQSTNSGGNVPIGDVSGNGIGHDGNGHDNTPISVPKPTKSILDMFKSTRDPNSPGVETLLTALPHCRLSESKDWTRLHPDEKNYWSGELCFVSVPIKGQKNDTLHLIREDLASTYLAPARVQRFRLALATKPYDVFFLCQVPSQNLDNIWHENALSGCLQAKTKWVQAISRKPENAEGYRISFAQDQDSLPEPRWPTRSLDDLIAATFNNRMITSSVHPGLLRLIGARQALG
jgi:hypothetical protein